ncbi:MAG: M23 family metallopeptidase [Candidatus Jorgensenbacteria bacterium]|nr:M23 family metallopeptidase [Candidatus Jorgensenbacteria bacterium]
MKRRGIRKALVRALLGIVLLLGVGAGVRAMLAQFPWWTRTETYYAPVVTSTPPAATPTSTSLVEPLPVPTPSPTFSLSRTSVEQSDTLTVEVRDAGNVSGVQTTWNGRTLDLLKVGETWLGFLGVDAKQAPGNYPLAVTAGTATLTSTVSVAKRAFPITVLATTPELEAEGHTPTAIQSNVAKENAELNSVLIYQPEAYFSKSFINPLDRMVIVGAYGNIRKNGDISLQHLGADLDAAEGTPVYAINDGIVRLAKRFTDYGNTIIVDHGLGIFSYYLHLSEFSVGVGDTVVRGQRIAKSGNTGYSIGPHLHFSVRIRNASVDPLRFIEAANAALATH